MYVYGVVRAGVHLRPVAAAGVDGRAVSRAAGGDLAAVIADGVAEPVRPSRRNVMAHSAVLQEVVAQADVLPMRFGVVMPTLDAVREELLGAHAEQLMAELDAVADCVELGLTVTSLEQAQLQRLLAGDRALREARGRTESVSDRIALGERVARGLEGSRAAVADRVVEALAPLAVDAALDEPRHADMEASVAFLVERRRVASFEVAVESLSAELGTDRRVRLVGPLPPYHFVDLGLEAAAWA